MIIRIGGVKIFITKDIFKKWDKALENGIAKLALQDYEAVNIKKDGTPYKKHRQYTLSESTLRLLQLRYELHRYYKSKEPLDQGFEEQIKYYLLHINLEILKIREIFE